MNRINVTPSSPIAGQQVEICYDFTGSGITDTTLVVTFGLSPNGESSSSHDVKVGQNCVTLTVPANAVSMKVHDSSGKSIDWTGDVEQEAEGGAE